MTNYSELWLFSEQDNYILTLKIYLFVKISSDTKEDETTLLNLFTWKYPTANFPQSTMCLFMYNF